MQRRMLKGENLVSVIENDESGETDGEEEESAENGETVARPEPKQDLTVLNWCWNPRIGDLDSGSRKPSQGAMHRQKIWHGIMLIIWEMTAKRFSI